MAGAGDWYHPPMVLDRVRTGRGELVLREAAGRFEIISNGVFLMDTSDGTSERLLVDAAATGCTVPAPRLLIGGLGVGFSLIRAVTYQRLAAIDVVEIEPTVIAWHHRYLRHLTAAAFDDPRVRIVEAGVLGWLEQTADRYDAICLDTDNGPDWLVRDDNEAVYDARGIDLAYRRLRPRGVLTVWSAARDRGYEERLRTRFGGGPADVDVLEVPRARGEPDVVYVARRPAEPA